MRWTGRILLACVLVAAPVAGDAARASAPRTADAAAQAAGERASRLNALFARLHGEDGARDHEEITAEIWRAWMDSGDPAIDASMREAVSAMSESEYPRALTILDAVVAKAPDFAEGWNKRATVLYILGEYERSLADIERVLALEPRHFGALSGQGMCFLALKRHAQALQSFRRAVKVHPHLASERTDIIPMLEKLVKGDPI